MVFQVILDNPPGNTLVGLAFTCMVGIEVALTVPGAMPKSTVNITTIRVANFKILTTNVFFR